MISRSVWHLQPSSNDIEGRASPDDLEAKDALHGFLKTVSHNVTGDVPAPGQQFVLKPCRIGLGQVNFVGMAAAASKVNGGGIDTALEAHQGIVPIGAMKRG